MDRSTPAPTWAPLRGVAACRLSSPEQAPAAVAGGPGGSCVLLAACPEESHRAPPSWRRRERSQALPGLGLGALGTWTPPLGGGGVWDGGLGATEAPSLLKDLLPDSIGQRVATELLLLLLSRFSRVRLCVTPWTAAHQAPLSLGFSNQEQWSGLQFPSPMHESEE